MACQIGTSSGIGRPGNGEADNHGTQQVDFSRSIFESGPDVLVAVVGVAGPRARQMKIHDQKKKAAGHSGEENGAGSHGGFGPTVGGCRRIVAHGPASFQAPVPEHNFIDASCVKKYVEIPAP